MTLELLGQLSAARDELAGSVPLVWFVLAGLVGCTVWTGVGLAPAGRRGAASRRRPSTRVTAPPAVVFALTWMLINGRMEGWVVFVLSLQHGVTTSDLAAMVALIVAGWRLLLR